MQNNELDLDQEDFDFLNENIRSYEDVNTILMQLQGQNEEDSYHFLSFLNNLSSPSSQNQLNQIYLNTYNQTKKLEDNIHNLKKLDSDQNSLVSMTSTFFHDPSNETIRELYYIKSNATQGLEKLQQLLIDSIQNAKSTINAFFNKEHVDPIILSSSILKIKQLSIESSDSEEKSTCQELNHKVDQFILDYSFDESNPFIPYSIFGRYLKSQPELFNNYIKKLVANYVHFYQTKNFFLRQYTQDVEIEHHLLYYGVDSLITKIKNELYKIQSSNELEINRIMNYFYDPLTIQYISNLPDKLQLPQIYTNPYNSLVEFELLRFINDNVTQANFNIFCHTRKELIRIEQNKNTKSHFEDAMNSLMRNSTKKGSHDFIYHYRIALEKNPILNKFQFKYQFTIDNLHEKFIEWGSIQFSEMISNQNNLFDFCIEKSQKARKKIALRQHFEKQKDNLNKFDRFQCKECFIIGYISKYIRSLFQWLTQLPNHSQFMDQTFDKGSLNVIIESLIDFRVIFLQILLDIIINENDLDEFEADSIRNTIQDQCNGRLNVIVFVINELNNIEKADDSANFQKQFLNKEEKNLFQTAMRNIQRILQYK